jgi:hypothetical protein
MMNEVLAHLVMIQWTASDANVIDIAAADYRWDYMMSAGVGRVPQDDERSAAPQLLHTQKRVGIARLAAENALIESECCLHVVDEKDHVIQSDKRDGVGG